MMRKATKYRYDTGDLKITYDAMTAHTSEVSSDMLKTAASATLRKTDVS